MLRSFIRARADSLLKTKSDAVNEVKSYTSDAVSRASHAFDAVSDEATCLHLLAIDEKSSSLNVMGPNRRPLFTSAPSLSQLTHKDTCTYFNFRRENLNTMLPEGLPKGMEKEFEVSLLSALLVRQSFLDLRDNFRRVIDPPMWSTHVKAKGPKVRKQIVLDGLINCGKSIALAMLVHWAREEGWLVFYVPKGREWTHGGYFYKHP